MFGMLDYRAHKLYWLFSFPFRIAARIGFWLVVVGAIVFTNTLSYSPLVKVLIAYVCAEAGAGVVVLILWPIGAILSRMFFWLIDVVPSKGEDAEEVEKVVRHGPVVWLGKKFANDIEHWTEADTTAFTSRLNWRARYFFNARERTRERVRIFRRVFRDTGRRPGDMSQDEVEKLVGQVDGNKLQRYFMIAIVTPAYFNSICAFAVIAFVILGLQS
jgi:hypothetical protein